MGHITVSSTASLRSLGVDKVKLAQYTSTSETLQIHMELQRSGLWQLICLLQLLPEYFNDAKISLNLSIEADTTDFDSVDLSEWKKLIEEKPKLVFANIRANWNNNLHV